MMVDLRARDAERAPKTFVFGSSSEMTPPRMRTPARRHPAKGRQHIIFGSARLRRRAISGRLWHAKVFSEASPEFVIHLIVACRASDVYDIRRFIVIASIGMSAARAIFAKNIEVAELAGETVGTPDSLRIGAVGIVTVLCRDPTHDVMACDTDREIIAIPTPRVQRDVLQQYLSPRMPIAASEKPVAAMFLSTVSTWEVPCMRTAMTCAVMAPV
jgi:hypothetical protein